MARILLVAKGTYGDMFPMYAIAQLLQKNGHQLTIATNSGNKNAALWLGCDVLEINELDPTATLGIYDKFLNLISGHARFIRPLLSPSIRLEYETLLPVARESDLIIGNQLAHTASMVKEKSGKPWVYCAASPLALLTSPKNPSLFHWLHGLQKLSMGSEILQKLYIGTGQSLARLLMRNFVSFRKQLGLDARPHPASEAMYSTDLNLLLTSPVLISDSYGLPTPTFLTGFTWFEPDFLATPAKLERLRSFLDAGPPAVIFTLGGDRRTNPGSYFLESIRACKLLGLRGIIVASERFHESLPRDVAILVTGYIPYSILFRNALAVVHSGGIGTIGWCIRYGIPSLLIPCVLDQFDNAYRATRIGIADTLPQRQYRAEKIARALDNLLRNPERKALLGKLSATVAAENGAEKAVHEIERLLRHIQNKSA